MSICGQKSWKDAQVLLHSVGYRDAKKYIICLDESHRCHIGSMESEDDLCLHCNKKGTIPYYYLGLRPKINLWPSEPIFCKKMLSHWFEKDHWLGQENQDGCGLKAKVRYGMEDVSRNFSGFGIPRKSGNYLPNVTIVLYLSPRYQFFS